MTGITKSIVAATALAVAAPVPAHADKASEINRALRTVFDSHDANRDGRLDTAEITHFADDLFAAMDTNGDQLTSRREFRGLSLAGLSRCLRDRRGPDGR